MFQKLKESALFCILSCIILLISLTSIILPDRVFSENENKYLAQPPKIMFPTLMDGSFSMKYEAYVNDQLVGRDSWIETKSITEYLLLKTENNGVVYGKNGYMFPKFSQFDPDVLIQNLDAIDAFAFNSINNVSVIVVPSAYYPLADYMPAGFPVVDQNYYINEINRYLSNTTLPVNVKDILVVNADKYIYYRTDHHWTSYGAWLAYGQFASARELKAFDYKSQQPIQVNNFLGTSYSKTKAFNVQPDILEYFDFPGKVIENGETHDSLYDYSKFEQRDKYAGLLHGNNAMTVIESEYSAKKLDTILVIRDSFADSFVPYLTQNYNKIIMIDPRYYNGSYEELRQTRYDDVLLLFGFENYCVEPSIAKLAGE